MKSSISSGFWWFVIMNYTFNVHVWNINIDDIHLYDLQKTFTLYIYSH
jgi:hypothetical protein